MVAFRRQYLASLLLMLPAFAYVIIRAVILDFTYDECWTFLGYASGDTWKLLTNAYPAANNHILHSLLMKGSFSLFGMSEFALRLPVVLAFTGYLAACHMLSRNMDWYLKGLFLLIMVYQPYLLDYFVAARGYGLAISLTMWALIMLKRFSSSSRLSHLRWALVLALLAAWSNFTYILHFIAIILALTVLVFQNQRRLNSYLQIGFSILIGVVLFAYPILQLNAANELYYGGTDGFFSDTLSSVIASFFYYQLSGSLLKMVLALVLFVTICWWFGLNWRMKLNSWFLWSGWLLFIPLFGSLMQHWLLDTPYPIDRTALYIMPFLMLTLVFGMSELKANMVKLTGFAVLGALSLVNFSASANLTYLADFKMYADGGKAMRLLADNDDRIEGDTYEIGKSVYLNAPINYYKVKLELDRLVYTGLEYCDDQDYPVYYLFEKDLNCVNELAVDTIQHFPVSNTYLFMPTK